MIKSKSKEWLKRYLPSEIAGTITAVSAASVAHFFYESHVVTAYAGSIGEAIGFYTTVFIQSLITENKLKKAENSKSASRSYIQIITSMLLEFGPAGLLDGLFLRPFFMFVFPTLLKNFTLGIFIGKIVGDITFYFLVIFSYEYTKRRAASKTNL